MESAKEFSRNTIDAMMKARKQIAVIGIVGAVVFLSGMIANAVTAAKIKNATTSCAANNKDLDTAYKTSWVLAVVDVLFVLLTGGMAIAAIMIGRKAKMV